jgi:hypothetical protein
MKAKDIKIEGFSFDLTPDDKPCLSVFAPEGCGKTRLAATMPDPIGLLAIDKKSKRTMEACAAEFGKQIIANTKPFMTDKEAIELALEEDIDKVRKAYADVYRRILHKGMALADHKDISSIVVDTNSQLFDYILFSHFGRRTQIKPTSRGAANQDMIDFISALRSKNVLLIHRAKEVWKSTGKVDKTGEQIKEPSGKFESDGYKNIGGFCTATIELTNNKKATNLDSKFRVKVVTCQTNSMLEGQDLHDYGVSGDGITWPNLMTALGIGE